MSVVINIIFKWFCNSSITLLCKEIGISKSTACSLIKKLENLLIKNKDVIYGKIGGDGIVVEVDESKFGKRKFNRGHRVDGVWVFGLVERTKQRKIILIEVKKRDAITLQEIIKKYIKVGSVIYSDGWKGYIGIEKFGYVHYVVNHSISFIDRDTGFHKNIIEGCWSAFKHNIPKRNRVQKKN